MTDPAPTTRRRAIDDRAPAAWAAAVRAAGLAAALARAGVTLVVHAAPLHGLRRTVRGAWDPLLRRIDLYDAVGRTDAELLTTLGHELAHALGTADESTAAAFAAAWVTALGPDGRACCAAAVRAAACAGPA